MIAICKDDGTEARCYCLTARGIPGAALVAIEETRRARLELLIERHGNMERLANAAGVSASYLSQIRNGSRRMGSRFARKIEAALGLGEGWFDGSGEQFGSAVETELFRKLGRAEREAVVVLLRALVNRGEPR